MQKSKPQWLVKALGPFGVPATKEREARLDFERLSLELVTEVAVFIQRHQDLHRGKKKTYLVLMLPIMSQ